MSKGHGSVSVLMKELTIKGQCVLLLPSGNYMCAYIVYFNHMLL